MRSKWAAGKARGGRISKLIRNRGATHPPAHFHRNPLGRGQLAVFPRCSLLTYRFRYARRSGLEKQPTDRRRKSCLFRGQDTNIRRYPNCSGRVTTSSCKKNVCAGLLGPHLRGDRFYAEVLSFKAVNVDGALGDRTLPPPRHQPGTRAASTSTIIFSKFR